MRAGTIGLATAVGIALILTGTTQAAVSPELKCQGAKNKIAGKYAFCRLNAESKLATKGDLLKYTDTIAKCATKYQAAWQKVEQKAVDAGSACPSAGDESYVRGLTDGYTDDVGLSLTGACTGVGGAVVGGKCWFLGEAGAGCDTVCGAAGLLYDPATRNYAGDLGTTPQCIAVIAAVSGPDFVQLVVNGPAGIGCAYQTGTIYRVVQNATSEVAVATNFQRACACR